MKTIRQHGYGGPEQLVLETVPDPIPGPGQVRVRVQAAGVHLLDVQLRSGAGAPHARVPLPMTPGREVAGRVDCAGSEVDPSWVGQYVVVDLGVGSGGYAELALAEVANLHRLPDAVDPAEAVAAIGTGRTVQAILELTAFSPSDQVVVTGASGGVGTMLVSSALNAGASVVAIASGTEKTSIAAGLGAIAVDSSRDRWDAEARAALGDAGATVVTDGIGGELGVRAMELLRPGGRLVMHGTASGQPIALDANTIFIKGITVSAAVGVRLFARPGGLRALEEKALAALIDGSLVPILGHSFPLEEAAQAQTVMEQRRSHGKVVLLPQPS